MVTGLNAASSTQFPANAQVVDVLDGLVVVEEDVRGDDSVNGAVHYVHLVDDGAGALVIGHWFVASMSARAAKVRPNSASEFQSMQGASAAVRPTQLCDSAPVLS